MLRIYTGVPPTDYLSLCGLDHLLINIFPNAQDLLEDLMREDHYLATLLCTPGDEIVYDLTSPPHISMPVASDLAFVWRVLKTYHQEQSTDRLDVNRVYSLINIYEHAYLDNIVEELIELVE